MMVPTVATVNSAPGLLVYALKHRLVEGEERSDSGWMEVS